MKNIILVSILLLAATNSHAVTADEFINYLDENERTAYVMASAEMAISVYINIGSKDKAACIREWLVNSPDNVMDQINEFLSNPLNSKYPAASVIRILFERVCSPDLQPQ